MADVSPSKQRESRRWEDLPLELLASIAECTTIPYYYRMRAVCSSWASASREVLPRALLPWIASRHNLSFNMYNIQEDRNYDFPLPLFLDKSKIVGTRDGWLVITSRNYDLNVLLFNLLTGAQIPLPDFQRSIHMAHRIIEKEKIVLSHSPVNATDLVAVALYRTYLPDGRFAAATKIGSNYWWAQFVGLNGCIDVAFDQHGRLFAVTAAGDVYICPEIKEKQHSASYFCVGNPFSRYIYHYNFNPENMKFHLVPTSSGDMLLIFSNTTCESCPTFDVFKVVYQRQGSCLIEISDFCYQSLFIDQRSCFSLCARDFPGQLKGNCIYFLQMDCYWMFNIGKEETTKFNISSWIQDQSVYPNWFIPSLA